MAAGLSTRFRGNKLLYNLDGVPVLSRVLNATLTSGFTRVTIVVGSSTVSSLVAKSNLPRGIPIRQIVNPNPQEGMASSMRIGISSVEKSSAGAAIILGDQPLITGSIINKLLKIFWSNPDKIVAPLIFGRRTNPVIFPSAFFQELLSVTGDVGGRPVLDRHPDKVVGLELGDVYDDTDLDTPDDMIKIKSKIFSKNKQA